ncbi:putative proline-rich receptor-like protein kinase PERK11 [Benincasa hispida]|uniref:putative proline-rich receptor-like protein kinase PERK11 n=1 Tax=Benincasa hispida TaxID=102211 RepID=UPI001901EB89|nr:putative proline-rich receptor-like protein kinase PERK11 [Benincasa hispida]
MAGQLPRPWFRLGSMTRPTTATTNAPIPDQPRPAAARVRPPIIRPAALTEPAEPTTPQRPKSPHQLPRAASLTPPVKNAASPPRVLPLPSKGQSGGTATASPAANPTSPKERSSSVVGSPMTNNNSKQPSPFPSPSIPKSIPAVPTPYQSPKPKATASPPSPLILPPPQLLSVAEPKHETIPQEVERKTVVFQKVMDKASQAEHHITDYHTHTAGFDQNGKQESNKSDENQISKDKGTIIGGNKKAAFDDNTRVITMAGENKGAFMEILFSSDKNSNSRHQQQQQQQNQDNNVINSPKDSKSKKKTMRTKTRNVLPMKAFFNSNVQGINNSILMDSKFTHHDPGIHLVFSSIPPSAEDEDDQRNQ